MPNIPSNSSRFVAWLNAELNLAGSIFDTAGHTIASTDPLTGASKTWRHGRSINSMPAKLETLGVYRVMAGAAPLNLPDQVAGAGGTPNVSAIVAMPRGNFNFTVNNGVVTFTPTDLNPGSGEFILGYDWDFGDGSPQNNSNAPTHVYTAIGTYRVRLRVMNNLNNRGAWVTKTVQITVPGSVSPSPTPTPPSSIPVGSVGTPPSGWVLRSAVPNGATIREYWIGNSVSDERLDTDPNAGVDAIAALNSQNHVWGRHQIPGAPPFWIYEHPNDGFNQAPFGYYQNALSNYQWDYLTIQAFQSDIETETEYAGKFLDIAIPVSGDDLILWIYQRWPSKRSGVNDAAYYAQVWNSEWIPTEYTYHSRDFFNRLYSNLRSVETRPKRIFFVPVGEVFYLINQRAAAGQIPSMENIWQGYSDDIHLSDTLSYVVAATHYAAFYYRSPVGMAIPSGYGTIAPDLALALQTAIWDTVREHPQCAYEPAS